MMRNHLRLILLPFLSVFLLAAADPTGRWTAEFQGPQGNPVRSVIVLKAQGENLTGTVEGMRGEQTAISDGKISGDEVTFTVVQHWQGVDFKIEYRGVLKKGLIHFTVRRPGTEGQSREFDAKRSS